MLLRALRLLRAHIACLRDPVAYHRSQGVVIGEHVVLAGADIHTFGSEPYLVRVGSYVGIANDVQFITHDGALRAVRPKYPDAFYYAPITIGSRVVIGAAAILLPGVSIGDDSVVAAGAVVATDVAPGTVVAGVPAKPIKTIEEYAVSRREDWIDTAGLDADEKRRVILERLADRWPRG
jgi:acetyltransferase-like isoleucine patch superfamily enzyme